MRCLNKNKQKMYYAQLVDTIPEYQLDEDGNKIVDYTDPETGEIYYVETGVDIPLYSVAVEFTGNISLGGSDVTRQEYGISDDKYEAVLVMDKNELPITETSLLWYQTTPTTKTVEEKTYADDSTADYKVLKIIPSLNNDRYILAKVVK